MERNAVEVPEVPVKTDVDEVDAAVSQVEKLLPELRDLVSTHSAGTLLVGLSLVLSEKYVQLTLERNLLDAEEALEDSVAIKGLADQVLYR
jgi:hypothetical protein